MIWNGHTVGWFELISFENYYEWGRWTSAETEETKAFLKKIEETEEALILVGTLKAIVNLLPRDGILDLKTIEWKD